MKKIARALRAAGNHREPNALVSSPRWWRMAIIAIYVLILCSCQSTEPRRQDLSGINPTACPPRSFYRRGGYCAAGRASWTAGHGNGRALPYTPTGPWSPPGISTPWPQDEYLRDGGHLGPPSEPATARRIRGLQMEDTVAQFQDRRRPHRHRAQQPGLSLLPRFGAVRQVVNLQDEIQIERSAGVHEPLSWSLPPRRNWWAPHSRTSRPATTSAPCRPASSEAKQGSGLSRRRLARALPRRLQGIRELHRSFARACITESETAWLSRGSDAAAELVEQAGRPGGPRRPGRNDGNRLAESARRIHVDEPGNPRLRIVKVASTPFAEPGDEVDFTLRFDNVGNQVITKVAIVDSLSTRLEYIPDSAQCSRAANSRPSPTRAIRWWSAAS